ncbi:MAG: hypothetical protein ACXQT3_05375, partial [Methermicoccaceae archaeon]
YFGERLVMLNVVVGNREEKRVLWSVAGDPEDFSGAGSGSADLEAELLDDDELMRGERLRNLAILYGQESIALMQYRPVPNSPFVFTAAVQGVGLVARRALANIYNQYHLFLARDNVYVYNGGGKPVAIGDPIIDDLMSRVNMDEIDKSFIAWNPDTGKARIHLPGSGKSSANIYYEYDVKEKSWTKGTRPFSGCGRARVVNAPTWASARSRSWDSWPERWDDVTAGRWALMYGDSSGRVFKDGEDRDILIGSTATAISAVWESKDFMQEGEYRDKHPAWMEVSFEARGSSDGVEVLCYSPGTPVPIGSTSSAVVALTSSWERYRVDLELWQPLVRLRLYNGEAGGWFEVRYLELGYLPSEE